jgi:hypothetical protein
MSNGPPVSNAGMDAQQEKTSTSRKAINIKGHQDQDSGQVGLQGRKPLTSTREEFCNRLEVEGTKNLSKDDTHQIISHEQQSSAMIHPAPTAGAEPGPSQDGQGCATAADSGGVSQGLDSEKEVAMESLGRISKQDMTGTAVGTTVKPLKLVNFYGREVNDFARGNSFELSDDP